MMLLMSLEPNNFSWLHNKKEAKKERKFSSTDLISSYSPSGGMKLMLRSESNLLRRTHWWKVQSSMAMDCFPLPGKKTHQTPHEMKEQSTCLLLKTYRKNKKKSQSPKAKTTTFPQLRFII